MQTYGSMLTSTQILFLYGYGIPIFLLNLRILYVLKTRYLEFSSSYYKIFFINGCNDCFLYVLNNYFIRWPTIEPIYNFYYYKFSEYSYWFTGPVFFVVCCSYLTHVGSLILSLNRFTAVYLYLKHEQFWYDFTKYAIMIMVFISLLFGSQQLFFEFKYDLNVKDNQTFVMIHIQRNFVLWDQDCFNSIAVGLFTVAGLVINLTTICMWHMREATIPRQHRDYERRMIVLTIIVYSIHMLSFVYNTFKYLIKSDLATMYLAYGVVSDLVALIPTLTIVLTSPSVRRCVFSFCPNFSKCFSILRNLCTKKELVEGNDLSGIDGPLRFSSLQELDNQEV